MGDRGLLSARRSAALSARTAANYDDGREGGSERRYRTARCTASHCFLHILTSWYRASQYLCSLVLNQNLGAVSLACPLVNDVCLSAVDFCQVKTAKRSPLLRPPLKHCHVA
jgi:hypothetical protein